MSVWDHYIDGRFVASADGSRFDVTDPATGLSVGSLARGKAADMDLAIEAADRAFHGPWSRTSAAERAALLDKIADAIEVRRCRGCASAPARR